MKYGRSLARSRIYWHFARNRAKYMYLMVFIFVLSFVQTGHSLKKRQNTLKSGPKRYGIFPIDPDVPSDRFDSGSARLPAADTETTLHDNTILVLDRPVEKSLWSTLSGLGIEQDLIQLITSIFESKVDFRRLREGDRVAIAFDKDTVDGRDFGEGTLRAARLSHEEKDFYAFYFGDEMRGGYYDEKGRSLESPFLPSPISGGRISSPFSRARLHPVSGKYAPHYGIDYAAPVGTPIMSVADGIVIETARDKAKGKFVRIEHGAGYETEYLHMSRFAKGIKKGVPVRQGQVIGYVGRTGIATGPHVELRLKKNGRFVNLLKEKFPSALLPATILDCFQQRAGLLKDLLEAEGRQPTSNFLFFCSAGRREAETI
ncbi:MAG: hypothetical protein C4576_31835 [Desulfobacteraceae bacterium]|nr:MAG: hypothetical protein C4576_31835 [Desulfobacteraceae bacterium]